MSKPIMDVAQRLEPLQATFARRRAELLLDLRREPPCVSAAPLARLREYGYATALLVAMSAALPTLVGIVFRRRKLVVRMVAAGLKLRSWRARLRGAQTVRRLR